MTAWAYYNEHDPFAAAWLRELIRDNLIAPGEVDERSIEDVTPDELRPFRQCHFFAGIGVWSLAARLAGIPDDAPLWSGSCPCQPFSAAGKGEGFADERHLWPAFHYLAEQCAPPLIVGEQVTGADGDLWLDLVSADMDATGYAFGAVETCAAGFGSPHERSRNYWMADRIGAGLEGYAGDGNRGDEPGRIGAVAVGSAPESGLSCRMADANGRQRRGIANGEGCQPNREKAGRIEGDGIASASRIAGILDDALGDGWRERWNHYVGNVRHELDATGRQPVTRLERPGPTNGLWSRADWLSCRDDRWRPIESGTFPLVAARTFRNRVGLLRGSGNAVNVAQAAGFLVAVRYALERL